MLDLRTKEINLPGIVSGAGAGSSRQSQIYEGGNTIYFTNIHCSVAGVAATDAVIDAQILGVEVKDNETVLVPWLTPAQLRAIYNHQNTKNGGAWPADTGDIPILHVPDWFTERGQSAYYGLGRMAEDGKRSTYKITIVYAAVITIDSVIPTLTVDQTEGDSESPQRTPAVPLGKHIRYSVYTAQAFAGTGDNPLTDVFRNLSPDACHELWFPEAVGTVDEITVIRDNVRIHDHTPRMAVQRQMHRGGLTVVASQCILAFNRDRDPTSALPLAGSPMVTITPHWAVSPAGSYNVLRVLEYTGHKAA